MSGLIVLLIIGIIVFVTSKIIDVSLKDVGARKKNIAKVLFSVLSVGSVWMLLSHQVYWAKYQCSFNTFFDIKRTVNVKGFYIEPSYSENRLVIILINEGYSFLETKTYKHEMPYAKYYIALDTDPNCKLDIFNVKDYRSQLMMKSLPSPPLPKGYCIAKVYQDNIQSQFQYMYGEPWNIKGNNGKKIVISKIVEIKTNEVLGSWRGYYGTTGGGLPSSESCLQPSGEQLYQKVLIPKSKFNKSSNMDASGASS